jgi:molecular chaperone GrpE
MNSKIEKLTITSLERDTIVEKVSNLIKDNIKLKHSINENIIEKQADQERFFLEILEIFDGIESLLNFLTQQDQFPNRMTKNLLNLQKKVLNILQKRGVTPITIKENDLDFNLCRVVDQEIRDDLEEKTITKIIRQGFFYQDKILRPTEVIISLKSSIP